MSHSVCAHHAAAAATFTCARCGTFGCDACRDARFPHLCGDCVARAGPPRLDALKTLEHAFRLFKARPRALIGLAAVSVAFGLAIAPASREMELIATQTPEDPFDGFADFAGTWATIMGVGMLYWAASAAVYIRVLGDEAAGRVRRPGEIAAAAARRLPALVLMMLMTMFAVYAGTVLCIVPGVVLGVAFALAAPAVVLEGAGPMASMGRSWAVSRGSRLPLALALFLGWAAYFGLMLVGMIPMLLLRQTGTAGYYLGTAVYNAAYTPGLAFLYAVLVAAWLQRTGAPVPAPASSDALRGGAAFSAPPGT